jgi:hypothetical protein
MLRAGGNGAGKYCSRDEIHCLARNNIWREADEAAVEHDRSLTKQTAARAEMWSQKILWCVVQLKTLVVEGMK